MEEGGTEVFRLSSGFTVFRGVILAFLALMGTAALVSTFSTDDTGGKVFMVVWLGLLLSQAAIVELRMPHTIEASPAGLRFVARTRVLEVPWPALESVESPWYDFGNQSVLWRWPGHRLRTWGPFQGFHRLLSMVEDRAPHARLRGL